MAAAGLEGSLGVVGEVGLGLEGACERRQRETKDDSCTFAFSSWRREDGVEVGGQGCSIRDGVDHVQA